jgi:hypothetical protein
MQLDFLVAGFSKCGTTTLCALLAGHPGVYIPPVKETNFFLDPDCLARPGDFDRLFAAAPPGAKLGEGSQFYASTRYEQTALRRMLAHSPSVRMIFIARDPIDRIESSFREFHHSGPRFGIDAPFGMAAALRQFSDLIDDSRYWTRLQHVRAQLPPERILVLFTTDLEREPEAVLARCWAFLGVAPQVGVAGGGLRLNEGGTKLRDTRLLRRLRTHRLIGPWLSRRFDVDTQDRIGRRLGLRRPFDGPVRWDEDSRRRVVAELADEVAALLAHAGKPPDFWPRFAAWGRELRGGPGNRSC